MANIFTNLLDNVSGDLADTNLKDFAHASRLYVQNFYRLAPKHGFLYFVKFNLNPNVVDKDAWAKSMRDLELGMLVKNVDLPKVTFEGPTLNIYNRKQPVYTKMQYTPINMALHDDNSGLVRDFWQMYYQYHSADSYYGGTNVEQNKNPIRPSNRYKKPDPITAQQLSGVGNPDGINYNNTTDPARYGLDVQANEPLIRSIEIYQLSRKVFFLHTLINPIIRNWEMDKMDQSANKPLEHRIQIEYEGVYFGKGKVSKVNPTGWTDLHYDLNPSPLGGLFGRGDGGLYGPYGLINDGTNLFADVLGTDVNAPLDQRGALATLIQASRLISKASTLNYDLATRQVQSAIQQSIGFAVGDSIGGSVPGLNIPFSTTETGKTSAQIKTVSPTPVAGSNGSTTVPDSNPSTQIKR